MVSVSIILDMTRIPANPLGLAGLPDPDGEAGLSGLVGKKADVIFGSGRIEYLRLPDWRRG